MLKLDVKTAITGSLMFSVSVLVMVCCYDLKYSRNVAVGGTNFNPWHLKVQKSKMSGSFNPTGMSAQSILGSILCFLC